MTLSMYFALIAIIYPTRIASENVVAACAAMSLIISFICLFIGV